VRIGSETGTQYPVLVGNPAYLSSLQAWYSSETALYGMITSYGSAAAGAWAVTAALSLLVDPTGASASVCFSAGTAAAAMATGATTAAGLLSTHLGTLGLMPAGFVSNKTTTE